MKNSPISIIIPTYREAANIEPLVRRIFRTTRAARISAEVVFVDDQSDDETVGAIQRMAGEYCVRVSVRAKERGLSSAVVHGFTLAKHDILVVMDADLQHPPESIPALVGPIASNQADFAIGSRYAPGGAIAERWSLPRRVASRFATMLARPLVRVRDPMSGYFALPRSTWQRAGRFRPRGYKIALELAVRARCCRIAEVPITFSTRQAEKSNLGFRQIVEYLRQLVGLYRFQYQRWSVAIIVSAIAIVLWGVLGRR